MKNVENALPVGANKRGELLTALSKKCQMRIALKDKPGPKQQELTDKEKKGLWEHLHSAEISYMNPRWMGKNSVFIKGNRNYKNLIYRRKNKIT